MNILNISQILPIPGIYNTNDFVFRLMESYQNQYPSDSVAFVRPVPYTNRILGKYFQQTSIQLPRNYKEYQFKKYQVELFNFISAWAHNNLHALCTHTVFTFNRKRIDRIIREGKITTVHAQFIFPDGLLALILKKKYNIPYILTSHTELKYFNSVLSRKIAVSILKNAYKVTPLNYKNLQFFKSMGLNNLKVIPLGIDSSFITKELHRTGQKDFKLVSLSELIKLKNLDKVLYAVSQLKHKFNIRYSIIGTGPEEESLKSMAVNLGIDDIVDFHGYMSNEKIPDILVQQDLFILPSYPETFGRVYFEAMAVGLPVICAVNSGIYGYFPEHVDRFAVNPDKPEEIIERIVFFINSREEWSQARKRLRAMVSEYTWENIAKQLGNLYRDAALSLQ